MNPFAESVRQALHLVADLDPALAKIVALSLGVSASACLIGTVLGLLAGGAIAVWRFPGRPVVLVVLNTLLALPSVVVGLVVYLLLSRAGPLGSLGILFTPAAMVVAQSVLVTPVVAALARQVIEDAMRESGEQLRSLGAGRFMCVFLIAWDERLALLTIALVAFGRAISEVGAVMIVGGNIDGVTRVMTTAIALETSKGDLPLALALGGVLLGGGAAAQRAGRRVARMARRGCASHGGGSLSASLVELHGATVCFGDTLALRDAHLVLRRGERVALVGANGSGKSTLLRVVHGLVPLDGGRRVVGEGPALRIAMVFQRPFMLRMSARANVELGLMLQGIARAERRERAMLALERVGLLREANRPGRVLSAGQQQRLALARAWALQPDLLLLDEPTASLDPTAKREVEALMEGFAAQGITMMMSSHNLGQVKRLAGRVIYLEHGRLVADVTTDHFFNGPLPEEARLFLKAELPWQ